MAINLPNWWWSALNKKGSLVGMCWLWDGEIIQKERMCVWNRCCWCPSYIFPCYFPFLSEHATFCLIFSLATGVDGGGVRELVSGRASFRLVEKYSSSLWSGSLKHFLPTTQGFPSKTGPQLPPEVTCPISHPSLAASLSSFTFPSFSSACDHSQIKVSGS